jgi:hypothetical protein
MIIWRITDEFDGLGNDNCYDYGVGAGGLDSGDGWSTCQISAAWWLDNEDWCACNPHATERS